MVTIDQIIASKIEEWKVGEWPLGNFVLCIIALVLATLLCGLIGIEREKRGRSAGLRTHLLVGVGSCMIMIISIYGFPVIYNRDVARLAAQVIAGVGFLGAGAIIHRNSGTRGLTTAATIWIVMAIGLTCGSMNFILAISGTLLILIVLTVFRKFETRITKKTPLIIVRASEQSQLVSSLLELAKNFDATIHELHVELVEGGEIEATFLAVSNTNELATPAFVADIKKIEGVTNVSVLNDHRR